MTSKTSGYDVFISYSHQNKTHADKVMETLKSLAPDLRIFIDTAGLNTGTSWQQILYNALDASSSTMALLSPDYIKSKVCYEEFCLSHALFVDKRRSMDLVSLLVEPVQELPLWCQQPLPADCASSHVDTDQVLASACADLVNRVKGTNNTEDDILTQRVHDLKKGDLTLELAMDNYRKSCFVLRSGVLKTPVVFTSSRDKETLRASHASDVVMSVDGHHVGVDSESSQMTSSESSSEQVTSSRPATCDVALSYAEGDKRAAVILKQLLLEKVPSLKISEPIEGDFSRVQSLDVARVIVPLLSPAFLASSELVEELNIAIFRNRSASRRILFPVQIATYPPKPSYVHLIPCEFSSSDYPWAHKIVDQNLQREVSLLAQWNHIDVDESFCLKNAATAICERLLEESKPVLNPVNRVLLNVHVIEEEWKQVKMALQREQGLESWKRTFGIEINSTEGDLKPARIFEQDDVMPDVETRLVIGDENESNGVELHLKEITNSEQNSIAGTDDRDQSQKLTKDHSLENESSKMERSVRFEDELTEEQHAVVTADNQPRSREHEGEAWPKESKACSLL